MIGNRSSYTLRPKDIKYPIKVNTFSADDKLTEPHIVIGALHYMLPVFSNINTFHYLCMGESESKIFHYLLTRIKKLGLNLQFGREVSANDLNLKRRVSSW